MSAMWANGIKTDDIIDAFKDGIEDSFKCKSNKSNHKHILEQFYEDGFKFGELLQDKLKARGSNK
tara:strand:+ start:3928 stop:4122 length:195 start_codon:yes stop_codon:yes gene_type:complete